ncbi:urea transporter [Cellulomonas chengniuliangii]|uniref:Urea transporter n=1 Tax=Cellulomonas chengniuliangii TaxID=2968084 RepID=A0ABY5L4Z5_9CELL|nr:urea transporter [Cellulomonas chengniuliangii]MCC2307562.1 urea transporter [Cellulomonas chengniuliangii]MCC2318674.1 urea transporter [Cellulomonas chengniuliangii]UUI75668.1 urea transporter [Cellulomonas chengniuliangii]
MAATNTPSPTAGVRAALDVRSLSDGLSQIFFQRNVWTGLLILLAFLVADWRMALLVVIGTVAATVTGAVMGAQDVRLGMQGFCGALLGAAVYTALGSQGWAYPIAVLGGILCAPVTRFFVWLFATRPLARFALPATTAPFCVVAGIMHATTTGLQVRSPAVHVVEDAGAAYLQSLLTNVSEVVLISSVWSGALILLGLFVASWKVGLAAVMGSAVGSLCALALGWADADVAEGLAGYSGVLTAIALSVVFLRSTVASWLYAVLGTAVTAVVTLALNDATDAPHYTWPYILTTWVLLIIATGIRPLRRP